MLGLMKLELPGRGVRLCDAGFLVYDGETYRSEDAVFGSIESIAAPGEGVGDEVPELELTFLPPGSSDPGDLSQPGWQTSAARFWTVEYDTATGAFVPASDRLEFWGFLDRTQLLVGAERKLAVKVVPLTERLFELNIGNSLTDRWHQSVWPGELGHVNATGLTIRVAWGAPTPPAAPTTSAAGAPSTGPSGPQGGVEAYWKGEWGMPPGGY